MGLEHSAWLAWGLGYGAAASGEVLGSYGSPEGIYNALGSPELDSLLTPTQRKRLRGRSPAAFLPELEKAKGLGLTLVGWQDEAYPYLLRHIPSPPPLLYCRGDAGLLNGRLSIAIVGTRRPSAYGKEAVARLGRGVAAGGAVIVSGLAAGLDAEAHKAALAERGPTIACIAFGHSHCYPAHNGCLMDTIAANSGLVLGEYPPDTKPEKAYFLQRNRLIAALSHGLLVTEAREQSGTMSTVNFAAEYGREVFAIPGGIFAPLSAGTNALIREGAHLAAQASDILGIFGVPLPAEGEGRDAQGRPLPALLEPPAWMEQPGPEPAPRQLTLESAALGTPGGVKPQDKTDFDGLPEPEDALRGLGGDCRALYAQLSPSPKGLGELIDSTGIATGKTLAALLQLEMAGLCVQLPGRRFHLPM